MLHVLTVAFRERRTVSAVVVWISHTAKSANVIFPFVASMKNDYTYARYILQIVLFLHVTIMCILHTLQIGLLFHISFSLHVVSSVCHRTEKRRTRPRTALNNVVSETSLPVTRYDTSFETMINTRQRAINDIVQQALHQHGYWHVCSSFIVCFL